MNWFRRASCCHQQEVADRELAGIDDAIAHGVTLLTKRLGRALARAHLQEASVYRCQIEQLVQEYHTVAIVRSATHEALARERYRPTPPPPAPGATGSFPKAAPITQLASPGPKIAEYRISSAKLAEAHAYLTQLVTDRSGPVEWMLAVTGLKIADGVYTLEDLIPIRQDKQKSSGASFDMSAFRPVANALYDHGQKLYAVFHSHPWRGRPEPSGVDRILQHDLEHAGYPAIQAVFSQDGYVRFYSNQRQFRVTISGKGVTEDDPRQALYRIQEFATLPSIRLASAGTNAGSLGRAPRQLPDQRHCPVATGDRVAL